jgi:agmatinase
MPSFLQPPSREAGTFLGAPLCTDLEQVSAPFAVIGAPHGSPYTLRDFAADTIHAPTAVRARSARFAASIGHYDFDLDGVAFGGGPLPFVDCGDLIATHLEPRAHLERTATIVRKVLDRGAVPVVLGGDDSIVTYVLQGYEGHGPLQVIQIDAHLDYRDEVAGVRDGLSSPMRRASEMAWVERIVHVGLRGVGSARASDVADSRADGNLLVKAEALRSHGAEWLIQQLPLGARYFVTIDVDGLDPSIAPGTRATMPGGLLFHEAAMLMRGLSSRGTVVGVDVVEYCPALDVNWTTADTVLRLLVNLLGARSPEAPGE